ncbi:hypothetical protein LTR03_007641 [Friedmanniomyces endolithicus]|nr:hypothetical protein LTR03_007641 [Friedmanniomyces endolithicus]
MGITDFLIVIYHLMEFLARVSLIFYCTVSGLAALPAGQQTLYDRGYRQKWLVGDDSLRLHAPIRKYAKQKTYCRIATQPPVVSKVFETTANVTFSAADEALAIIIPDLDNVAMRWWDAAAWVFLRGVACE